MLEMRACNTNCVEKPISIGFMKLGLFVGKHPWVFLVLPLILSGGLGGGFYFLGEREASDIEDQFTPVNGQAKTEREYVKTYFPHSDEFSQLRLYTEGTYASVIMQSSSNKDLLSKDLFRNVINLDHKVRNITSKLRGSTYADLCAYTNGKCVSNAVLDIAFKADNTSIDYPFHRGEFLGSTIGGVTLKPNSKSIQSAEAIRLFYFLNDAKTEKTDRIENDAWLQAFIKTFSKETPDEMISVSYFTSISRQEEFQRNTKTVTPFFSITYFLAINIAVNSCLRLDCVRNKVWVALAGVFSTGLAVLSSFGLLLFCGMPFAIPVASAPFLILGIGVDDMFIMISCWQRTKVHDKVEDRMAETYKEAAVSITITTLTDALAFYIGLLTPFRSVQSFCMYTGTAILFCYIYNITFFGACLALNGRREKDNRHWLTCRKVETPDRNKKSNACSVGGAYDSQTGAEEIIPINVFFKTYYGPFLTNIWTKVFVVFLYVGYLAGSIYGCFQMKEGIDLKNIAPDDSYVATYYDNEHKYFSFYGPYVMLIIKDEGFKYWETSARENLNMCLKEFESSNMVTKNMTLSWLDSYEQYGAFTGLDISDKNAFMRNLPTFLDNSGFYPDVNISSGKILASRLFIPSSNINTATDEKNMLNFFRDTASTCGKNMDLLVYHPAFIYFDQYAVIVSNTIQNIVVATAVMLVISLLLIPHPLCSLWVTFAIASVIVGVAGFMALWDVNLDSISMINLVICIGFSVDFSAHISYAFVSSSQKTPDGKAIDALYNLGYPIIQGAVSTVAGVVVLSAAKSYIFRTFFKIMFLVILFGAVHGLVFIPVFLTFFGVCGASSVEDEKPQTHVDTPMSSSVVDEKPQTHVDSPMSSGVEDEKPQTHVDTPGVQSMTISNTIQQQGQRPGQIINSTAFNRGLPYRPASIQPYAINDSKQTFYHHNQQNQEGNRYSLNSGPWGSCGTQNLPIVQTSANFSSYNDLGFQEQSDGINSTQNSHYSTDPDCP